MRSFSRWQKLSEIRIGMEAVCALMPCAGAEIAPVSGTVDVVEELMLDLYVGRQARDAV
jgi:hypothetical protein